MNTRCGYDGFAGAVVPLGDRRGLVVSDAVRPGLLRRELARHVHGHGRQPEPLRGLPPRVPNDQHPVGVDHDGLAEPVFTDAVRHRLHGRVVAAGI